MTWDVVPDSERPFPLVTATLVIKLRRTSAFSELLSTTVWEQHPRPHHKNAAVQNWRAVSPVTRLG